MDEASAPSARDGDLQQALQTVTSREPTRPSVRIVVDRCHRMARAYLRQQQQTGGLRENVLGEDLDDLAMDAIAGLFERDDQGQFPELQRYFADTDLQAASQSELEHALRQLVLGTVSDWLFDAYRAADRSLSNLIRALKRAVDGHAGATLIRRGKTLWLQVQTDAPSSNGAVEHSGRSSSQGRRMPIETLEAHLTGAVADDASTPALLNEAVKTLRAHPVYEAAYPLTRLAQALRAAQTRVQSVTEHSNGVAYPDDPLFRAEEIEGAIERSLGVVRAEKRSTYVDDGVLDEQTYAAYFRALRDRLEARFVPPGDAELTHHDALAAHLDGLPKERYRDEHRSRFEYLDRCVREALVDHLQETV
jgi:hypothetical protein